MSSASRTSLALISKEKSSPAGLFWMNSHSVSLSWTHQVVPQDRADDIEQSIKERMRGFERNDSCYGDVMREIAQAAGVESLALCDYDEDTV